MGQSIGSVSALRVATAFFFLGVVTISGPVLAQSSEPIKPIPTENKLDPKKVALGERLFNDKRLSKDNSLACAGCHNLAQGGVDGLSKSVGIGGAKGSINAPTVFNSAFNFRQFWD